VTPCCGMPLGTVLAWRLGETVCREVHCRAHHNWNSLLMTRDEGRIFELGVYKNPRAT